MYTDDTEPVPHIHGERRVRSVEYAVSKDFVYGMFNSCRDVQNPATGQKVLDMLCGTKAAKCTPELLLAFIGSQRLNPKAPFDIKFMLNDSKIHLPGKSVTLYPMKDKSALCNESCSCQDCAASCKPLPPDAPPPPSPTICGIDPMYFVMTCVFVVFVLVFGTSQILSFFSCPSATDGTSGARVADAKFSIGEKAAAGSSPGGSTVRPDGRRTPSIEACRCHAVGATFEKTLTRCFRRWGGFCARRPAVVLSCGVVGCIILSVGVVFFDVVSDPVELWSAPDSRARHEKDYFDDNFG